MNGTEATAARWALLIYTTLALAVSFIFLSMTFVDGNIYTFVDSNGFKFMIALSKVKENTYTSVARVGGMIWVFILSMIIFMPIVIPAVKKRILG